MNSVENLRTNLQRRSGQIQEMHLCVNRQIAHGLFGNGWIV